MLTMQDLMVVIEAKVPPPRSVRDKNEPTTWLRAMIADEAIEAATGEAHGPLDHSATKERGNLLMPERSAIAKPRRSALLHARDSLEADLLPSHTVMRFRFLNPVKTTPKGIYPVSAATQNKALLEGVLLPFHHAMWRSGSDQASLAHHERVDSRERQYLLSLWKALVGPLSLGGVNPQVACVYYTNIDGSRFH
jgi:hypothetical protein